MASISTISTYPYPTPADEQLYFDKTVSEIKNWWESPRFKNISRSYSPEKVASFRGTLPISYPSSSQAQKLFNLLSDRANNGLPVHTIGSVDPVQMTQSAPHQEVVYISGWACSSLLTTTNEVSPDFGDYPYDTVPNQVDRIFRAQLLHDRKAWHEWLKSSTTNNPSPRTDYLRPIIADGDTGHGGTGAVMKLAKLFAEKGAAAVHFEDQLHGGKKCGHLAGKVIVPTSTHITRLNAARLQWDIMGTENLLIARTDSETANLLSSSVDPADHEFILGVNKPTKPLAQVLEEAQARGASSAEIDNLELQWTKDIPLMTFNEAVLLQLNAAGKSNLVDTYLAKATNLSNYDARALAQSLLGSPVFFDWDAPRTREGYHPFRNGIHAAVKRAIAFAPYSDLLWLETKTPNLAQAQHFAAQIRDAHPGKWLVYNLSPSFNWLGQGFSQSDLKDFVWNLAKAGFTLQLISLAGLHTNGLATAQLASAFKDEGMLAYVRDVQAQEKKLGIDLLTHQKWSGANFYDDIISTVLSGSASTSSVGKDSTENAF